jgi:hypothetical protein
MILCRASTASIQWFQVLSELALISICRLTSAYCMRLMSSAMARETFLGALILRILHAKHRECSVITDTSFCQSVSFVLKYFQLQPTRTRRKFRQCQRCNLVFCRKQFDIQFSCPPPKQSLLAVIGRAFLGRLTVTQLTKHLTQLMIEVKGKAIRVQAWTGREGSRRLRIPEWRW